MDWIPTLMEEAECIRYPFAIKAKQMNKGFCPGPSRPGLEHTQSSLDHIFF